MNPNELLHDDVDFALWLESLEEQEDRDNGLYWEWVTWGEDDFCLTDMEPDFSDY